MINHVRTAFLGLLLLTLAGCATLGPQAQQPIGQALAAAQSAATLAYQTGEAAFKAGTIDRDTAQQVIASADLVVATVRLARNHLEAGDAAGAQSQLDALAADLAALQDFLKHQPGAAP